MSKINQTEQDAIAAFLAKKAPTKVAEGEGLNMTNRQWYRKGRDDGRTERQWEKRS